MIIKEASIRRTRTSVVRGAATIEILLMTSLLAILALGFMLGMRHATDPDHVVAVTTIVAGHRNVRSAALIGAAWGVGHTLTILLVGSGIILFKWVIPPRLGLGMELTVALMLIVLGVANLAGTMRWIRRQRREMKQAHVHSHAHSHGDYVHTHPHGHQPEAHPHPEDATPLARIDQRLGGMTAYRLTRPLLVGIVHGLAGSAAVALLVLAAIQTPLWSVLYLLIFGLGTIAGMMLITAAISIPFVLGGGQFLRLQRSLRVASGLISLAFGLVVAYQIGIGQGLFGANPQWTPK
jgi:ABC-type nickel/cobalt efflux system permease component RcnA